MMTELKVIFDLMLLIAGVLLGLYLGWEWWGSEVKELREEHERVCAKLLACLRKEGMRGEP